MTDRQPPGRCSLHAPGHALLTHPNPSAADAATTHESTQDSPPLRRPINMRHNTSHMRFRNGKWIMTRCTLFPKSRVHGLRREVAKYKVLMRAKNGRTIFGTPHAAPPIGKFTQVFNTAEGVRRLQLLTVDPYHTAFNVNRFARKSDKSHRV